MQNGKLGVAIHGAGWVAGAHVLSWMKNPHVEVVSIGDVDLDRARQFAENNGLQCPARDNYDDVLADEQVDIVDVTGPSHVHAQQGVAAAEAGKHVLVEKPMAMTSGEGRELIDLADGAKKVLMVGHTCIYNSAVRAMKRYMKDGEIGDVYYILAQRLSLGRGR